jgi:hypothetical protein
VPIERTPAFRLLQAIADLLRDQSYEAAAALVRHPAFGEWLTRLRWQVEHPGATALHESDGWMADLDEFLCDRLPHTLTGDLGGAEGRGRSVAEALRTALLGEHMLGSLAGVRPLREWMRPVLTLVLELYGGRPLHRHVTTALSRRPAPCRPEAGCGAEGAAAEAESPLFSDLRSSVCWRIRYEFARMLMM